MDNGQREQLHLPPCFAEIEPIKDNNARQLIFGEQLGTIEDRVARTDSGSSYRLLSRDEQLRAGEVALRAPKAALKKRADIDPTKLRWDGQGTPASPREVRESFAGQFVLREASDSEEIDGLRRPQVGAVHSVLGYWTTGLERPATVVMPTGTGKTETMVALTVASAPERVLVVVPSDALRTQIAEKFERLGVLRQAGVVGDGARYPIVGRLKHRFETVEQAQQFADACNVVVTTPPALWGPRAEIVEAFLERFTDLYVDEAHHVSATTWQRIVNAFTGRRILQFTATPFREDGQPVGGRHIYRFPLKRAQTDRYFADIEYRSVVNFAEPDRALARAAIERLKADLDSGFDHVLMARVRSTDRADELVGIYQELASELRAVSVHSKVNPSDRKRRMAQIHQRDSRIVVCVDMLGEGFDLPQLKIAAIHSPHKSLGVTLQFIGRFARVAGDDIGTASVFVGPPEGDYDERIRRLYSEDADWNELVRELTDDAAEAEAALADFEEGFGEQRGEVSPRSLAPKMSCVVYRTHCLDWSPRNALKLYPEDTLLTRPLPVNEEERVAVFVVELRQPVQWGDLPAVEEVKHHLFVIYWDADNGRLYINSSDNSSVHKELAKEVAGDDVVLINGHDVYRAMANLQRLVPTNIGLLDVQNANRRFQMLTGANVVEGLPDSEASTKTQTNIFGSGYEGGEKVTIGASLKGRVWSYQAAGSAKQWMDWCDHIGDKLTDETISAQDVIGSFIRPEALKARPALVPLAMEWPWEHWTGAGISRSLQYNDQERTLAEAELAIQTFSDSGDIFFNVETDLWQAPYRLDISEQGMAFVPLAGEVQLVSQRKTVPLSAYLAEAGPQVIFEQDALVVAPNLLLKPEQEPRPIDPDLLVAIDWSGINLSKESQGRDKESDSIQFRMMEEVKSDPTGWDLVVDDDGTGEIADIVAIRRAGQYLDLLLMHCKWAQKGEVGKRVADLYELCGQAQKSVRWKHHLSAFFARLTHRERQRVVRGGQGGIEVGNEGELFALSDESRRLRPRLTIAVAQPGVTKAGITIHQQHLLGSAQSYANVAAAAAFRVYCSA